MAAQDINQMATEVAQLMEQRLRLGGKGLSAKLRRGGRLLPRKVRRAAQHLAGLEGMAAHPKGARLLDQDAAGEAYRICMDYLRPLGSRERMIDRGLHFAASLALIVLVVGGGLLAVLSLRGYL